MKLNTPTLLLAAAPLMALALSGSGCTAPKPETAEEAEAAVKLSDDEVENLVRRSYQYVAMYNVINKNAIHYEALANTASWNSCFADTELKDHTYKTIARPNNDTLYTGCLLDLRAEPVVVEYPAFDSDYAALETSAYDHYCGAPLSTRKGDFRQPVRALYYSERSGGGYTGEPVEGVDVVLEMTGDFAIAFLRVMPHASEPERLERNLGAMKEVKALTLSEYLGGEAAAIEDPGFPAVGETDFDIFGKNLLEVMQFVFNHTSFDPDDEIDQAVLAAYEPLGVRPGKMYDPATVATIDGARVRRVAETVAQQELAKANDPELMEDIALHLFKPKGQMSLDMLLLQSVLGPIGLPAEEAVYPAIATADGEPLNARFDYVIRMAPDELPPAEAFWSVTLYDLENGFFIPNDRKKYSVGKNAGMQLNDEGGIAIHIAAEQPERVPEQNWLPIERKNEELNVIMRIYAPDLQRYEAWTPPRAHKVSPATG